MQLPTKVGLGGKDRSVESQIKKKVPQLGNKGYTRYYDDGLCKEGVEFYSKINDQVLHGDYKIKNFPQGSLDKKYQSRKIATLGGREKPIVNPLKKTASGSIFTDQKNQKIRNISALSYPSLSTYNFKGIGTSPRNRMGRHPGKITNSMDLALVNTKSVLQRKPFWSRTMLEH
jgi:hypothetical protein